MKKLIIAAAVAAAVSSTAFAADLDTEVVDPVFGWGGFYAGVQIGYGRSDIAQDDTTGFDPEYDIDGIFGGVHVGYNHQFDSLVIGVEADYNFSGIDGDTSSLAQVGVANNFVDGEIGDFGSIRARVGVAIDRTLIYGTIGYAWGDAEASQTATFAAAPRQTFDVGRVSGVTFGAGIEYALAQNWTMRAEYRHYDFSERQAFPGVGGYTARTVDVSDLNTFMIGASYKF